MKASRLLIAPIIILSLALLACASLPSFTIPSLSTATARAALTATVGAGGTYTLNDGLQIGSVDDVQKAVDANTSFLESKAKEQYQSEELSQAGKTYPYTIALSDEEPLIMQTNWCTTTADLLKQNVAHIHVRFVANDQVIDSAHIAQFTARNGDMYCAYTMALISKWPQGKTTLTIDVNFDAKINDGMSDYPAGTHHYQYTVTKK